MAPGGNFSDLATLAQILIGGSGLLAVLYGMAAVARTHMQVHDMRRKVAKLRRRYAAELAGQQDGPFGEAEIIEVDEAPPIPATPAKAA